MTVVISARGEERLRSGHPWIYRADVADVRAEAGDLVQVRSPRGRTLGSALFSDRSQITLRMLTYGDAPGDEALMRRRIEAAIAFRASLAIDATAYRLVHGEADLLPSLIVDRYGDYLVVQALSQGMDRLLPALVSALTETAAAARHPRAQRSARARVLEGLEQRVDVLAGEVPESVTVTESGIEYDVDLRRGQKTGLFLDQRENRAAAARYARGRLLDCFSYNGGFALVLGRSCEKTIAIDVSEDAIARVRQNAARNGVAVDARVGNVFDELRGSSGSGERFDTIVLDPPAFAKNKAAVANARAGYKEINLRALKLLNPGGTLVTCSCSYQRQRSGVRRDRLRRGRRRAGARDRRREADAGARSSGAARRSGNVLSEMLHPPKAGVARAIARARRELTRMARPVRRLRREPVFSRRRRSRLLQRRHRRHARAGEGDSRRTPRRVDAGRRGRVRRRADRRSLPRGEVGRHRGGRALSATSSLPGCFPSGSDGSRRTTPPTGRRPTPSAAR